MNNRYLLLFTAIFFFLLFIFFPIHISRAQQSGTPCATKKIGDADCQKDSNNNPVTLFDYVIWLSEYINNCTKTTLTQCGNDIDGDTNVMDANFNYPSSGFSVTDELVDIFDFVVWRQGYLSQLVPSPTPTVAPTTTPIPPTSTPTPAVSTTPAPFQGKGIWISQEEIKALPISGDPACNSTCKADWDRMKYTADIPLPESNLYWQDSRHPQRTLAVALVAAKLGPNALCGGENCRAKALRGITDIYDDTLNQTSQETQPDGSSTSGAADGRTLALGRNLMAYVVAADVIDLASFNPTENDRFKTFIRQRRDRVNAEGKTDEEVYKCSQCESLVTIHTRRPNNWGTMAGASRIAVDIYLGDTLELEKAVTVFKGYIGDTQTYTYTQTQFSDKSKLYACDSLLRPINPPGCTIKPPGCTDGRTFDFSGAPIDDVQREWDYPPLQCPPEIHYAWGGFSAAAAQAEMLYRANYDAYNWQNKAIYRSMKFLVQVMGSSNSGATYWLPSLAKKRYASTEFDAEIKTLPGGSGSKYGRLMDWTAWTLQ